MTVLSEDLDSTAWWTTIEDQVDTPLADLIDDFDEIADRPIPYNWLPGRAATFYGTDFTIWSDLATETITSLVNRPKGGIGTVRVIMIAAREAITLARTTRVDVDQDPATAASRLIDRLSRYDYTVLSMRVWALNPHTRAETAEPLGVRPINIQRNQPRAHQRFTDLLTEPPYAAITDCAEALRRHLGPLTCEQAARRALIEHGLDLSTDAGQMVLHLAGPYARKDGWLERAGSNGVATAIAAVDAALLKHGAPTTATLVQALTHLGTPERTAHDFLDSRPGLRRIADKWVRWETLTDKIEAALHLRADPMHATDITTAVGEGYLEARVRDILNEDSRFVRASKQTWALRRWGIDEYTGLASEIAARIDAHRRPVSTRVIVDDLISRFPDVSESSIRSYLGAPGFVIEKGTVRRRKKADGWAPVAPLNTVRAVFRNGPNEIRVALTVDADLLRGSGQSLHPALATALGLHPGDELTFTGTTTITVYWRTLSPHGASVGSLRALAGTLNSTRGDTLVLVFNTADSTVDATLIGAQHDNNQRLRVLLGASADDPRAALARALTCTPEQLRPLLARRGETQLLAPDESGPTQLDERKR